MLIATIITYNDMPLIKDCIESVWDKVDKIVVVDGKFRDFPGTKKISTDGTIGYLSQIEKVEIMLTTDLTEIEKRNT